MEMRIYIHIHFYRMGEEKVMGEKNKKKIAILSNGLARGGTDTFVINLVRGLDKSKYSVTVILSVDGTEQICREDEILEAGGTVLKTCALNGGIQSKVRHLKLLYRIMKKGKYDVFQTNIDLFNGPNLFVSWLARVPIRICHSHNSMQEREIKEGKTVAIKLYQWIMRKMCLIFSNRYAGCSELAMEFLFGKNWNNLNKKYKAIVVHNGIDLVQFQSDVNKEEKRKKLGIRNEKIIITVGRLSLQKNPLMLVEIFAELCKIRQDCDLLWVGNGEMLKKLQDEVEKLDIAERVHFLGIRTDVNELMQCSDLFLFPSLFEGFGIVAVEAQAAGLPCLVSDTLPKVVDCDGCEFMSLSKSACNWAEVANNILDGKKEIKISNAKLQLYSVEHMVSQMESLFI